MKSIEMQHNCNLKFTSVEHCPIHKTSKPFIKITNPDSRDTEFYHVEVKMSAENFRDEIFRRLESPSHPKALFPISGSEFRAKVKEAINKVYNDLKFEEYNSNELDYKSGNLVECKNDENNNKYVIIKVHEATVDLELNEEPFTRYKKISKKMIRRIKK